MSSIHIFFIAAFPLGSIPFEIQYISFYKSLTKPHAIHILAYIHLTHIRITHLDPSPPILATSSLFLSLLGKT